MVKNGEEITNQIEVLIHYQDKVTSGNGEKESDILNKGKINSEISSIIFNELEKSGINTHYIKLDGPNVMRCKKVNILPIEVVVRNYAAGYIVRNTTIEPFTEFIPPLVEFYLKDDNRNDPLLTEDRLEMMGCHNVWDIKEYAKEVNDILYCLFGKIGIFLVDFKLEFGYIDDEELIIADEISPDSCRLMDIDTNESMDKDLFRKDEGDIICAYSEILRRLKEL